MSSPLAASQVDRVSMPAQSMCVATPIRRLSDQTLVFGLRQPALQPETGDQSVPVNGATANRLDLISFNLYGQPRSWWAIADVSGLVDPLAGVPEGLTLRAPASSRLPS